MVQGKLFETENVLSVRMPESFFCEILNSVNLSGFPVVALEFANNQVRIRALSSEKNQYLHAIATSSEMLIKNEGYLIVDCNTYLMYLKKFIGTIEINQSPNQKVVIKDDSGNEVEIVPKNVTEIENFIPPETKIFPVSGDGIISHVAKDPTTKANIMENGIPKMVPMPTQVWINPKEISKGIFDMEIADADYVVYNMSQTTSYASSGRYSREKNSSKSKITAKVTGPDAEIIMPKIIKDFVKSMKNEVRMQIDASFPMAFFCETKKTDTSKIDVVLGLSQWKRKATTTASTPVEEKKVA